MQVNVNGHVYGDVTDARLVLDFGLGAPSGEIGLTAPSQVLVTPDAGAQAAETAPPAS